MWHHILAATGAILNQKHIPWRRPWRCINNKHIIFTYLSLSLQSQIHSSLVVCAREDWMRLCLQHSAGFRILEGRSLVCRHQIRRSGSILSNLSGSYGQFASVFSDDCPVFSWVGQHRDHANEQGIPGNLPPDGLDPGDNGWQLVDVDAPCGPLSILTLRVSSAWECRPRVSSVCYPQP